MTDQFIELIKNSWGALQFFAGQHKPYANRLSEHINELLDKLYYPEKGKIYRDLRVSHRPGEVSRLVNRIQSATEKAVRLYLDTPHDIDIRSVIMGTRYTDFGVNLVTNYLYKLFRNIDSRGNAGISWRTTDMLKIELIFPDLVRLLEDPHLATFAMQADEALRRYRPNVILHAHTEDVSLRGLLNRTFDKLSEIAEQNPPGEYRPRNILLDTPGNVHVKLLIKPHASHFRLSDIVLDHSAHVEHNDCDTMYTSLEKLLRHRKHKSFVIETLVDDQLFNGPQTVDDFKKIQTHHQSFVEEGVIKYENLHKDSRHISAIGIEVRFDDTRYKIHWPIEDFDDAIKCYLSFLGKD